MAATASPLSDIKIDFLSSLKNTGQLQTTGNSNNAIYSNGLIHLNGGVIKTNSAGTTNLINLQANSTLIMEGSSSLGSTSIGEFAVNAIIDNGAKGISGSGSTVHASSSCWSGDIFALTDVLPANIGQSGSTSSTTDVTLRMFNRSSWNCN